MFLLYKYTKYLSSAALLPCPVQSYRLASCLICISKKALFSKQEKQGKQAITFVLDFVYLMSSSLSFLTVFYFDFWHGYHAEVYNQQVGEA